jgi:multisubunit Na+/H+ antiporter MnhB subunit
MLLFGKLMVDSARWVDSDWRLVMVVWAYVLIIVGMWLTVSPWRMRDFIEYNTATPQRTRVLSAMRLAFGVFVAVLGFVVF